MFGGRRRRREEELARVDRFRIARRFMDEEVTVLGEQVAELLVDTLADVLDGVGQHHYRQALEHYDQVSTDERTGDSPGPRGAVRAMV